MTVASKRISDRDRQSAIVDYLTGIPGMVIAARLGVHQNYARNEVRRRGHVPLRRLREARLWRRAKEVRP